MCCFVYLFFSQTFFLKKFSIGFSFSFPVLRVFIFVEISTAENEIGQRDELIDQLSQTIDDRESTITRLEQKRLRERKKEMY